MQGLSHFTKSQMCLKNLLKNVHISKLDRNRKKKQSLLPLVLGIIKVKNPVIKIFLFWFL